MREIKFRAWDIRNEVMWLRKPKQLVSEFFQLLEQDTEGGEQFTLMQYTGIKDKNGVEIYEGDIVRLRFHEAPDSESFENGTIKWHVGSAAFKWFSGEPSDLNNYWLTHADDEYREVIGNVYENKDLL